MPVGTWLRGRRVLVVVGVLVLLVGAVLAALRATYVSRAKVRVAESRALAGASIALSSERPETALLLAVEAMRLVRDGSASESYEARNALVHNWEGFARMRAIMRGHRGEVSAVAFSPDGTIIASGGADGTIRLWDARRRVLLARVDGHRGGVEALAWRPSGALLASGGADKVVRLWQVRRLTPAGVLRGHSERVSLLAFSSDGQRLASGQQYGQVRVWDVERLRQSGATLKISPVALRFDTGRGRLVVVSTVGVITGHDARSPKPYNEPIWDTGYTEYFGGAFTDTGRWLALAGEEPLAVWRMTRGGTKPLDLGDDEIGSRTLAAGAHRLAIGYRDGRLRIVTPSPDSLDEWRDVHLHNGAPTALDLTRGDAVVAAGGADGTVRLVWSGWEAPLTRRVAGGPTVVDERIVLRSFDGRYVARFGAEVDVDHPSTLVVRDGAGRQVGRPLKTRGRLAAFLPDGRIALVGRDRRLRLWDVKRGEASEPFPRGFPDSEAAVVAFSEDGRIAATASESGVELWDVARWAPIGDRVRAWFPFPVRLTYDRAHDSFAVVSASSYGCCPGEYSDLAVNVLDPILASSDFDHWRDRICRLVSRNLTRDEWRVHVPDRAYHRTCP